MKKEYVLLLVIDSNTGCSDHPETNFLLIMKDRPPWMSGFLNLVGGKVEPNESHYDAAIRELKEETGLYPTGDLRATMLMGTIEGDEELIYCYRIYVEDWELHPQKGETEKVRWFNWDDVKYESRLMPNLRVIIPLMLGDVKDWRWINNDECVNKKFNSGYLTFPGNANPRFSKNDIVDYALNRDPNG